MNTIVWQPKHPEKSQMWQFMRYAETAHPQSIPDYQTLHTWSVTHPEQFWPTLCDYFKLRFDTPATHVLTTPKPMFNARWFEGARLNFAKALLSRNDDHPALICLDEQGNRQELSYRVLKQHVADCAAGLKKAGVTVGDCVAGMLPNTSHTIIAMLATASIGAIWASCSPDFGVDAAVDRLGQIDPKVLFICDGYTYLGKPFNTVEKMHTIQQHIPSLTHVIVCPFLKPSTVSIPSDMTRWDAFIVPNTTLTFASLPFDHPLYILFSSGTTGKPKCIMHGAGGTLLQHIKELGLHTDLRSEDNLFFYTTCGWMMWNWMVSGLALGATLTLYDGAPMHPTPMRLFKLIEQEHVTVFGTSAKFLSAVEKAGSAPNQEANLDTLRCIISTGSPLLPEHYDFVYQHVKSGVQLCSISGGTDIVSCFALGNPILPIHRGELQCIGLGMDVHVFDEQGRSILKRPGELVCTTPFPSMPIGFWHDPDRTRYHQAYFEKYPDIWTHGDRAEITVNHGLVIYGRSDTTLNPGGVRIGTAEIYRQIEKMDAIVDSVVIGQPWEDDVRVVLFVKLREGLLLDEALERTIKQTIRTHASPKHVPAKILQVLDIPRTINGKTVEVTVRDIVEGKPVSNLDSLANPEALRYFENRPELSC